MTSNQRRGALGAACLIVGWSLTATPRVGAQVGSARGGITGTVTATGGEVRGLRVKARDTVNRITYTVFTRDGRYQLSGLPPGAYDVRVLEERFESPVVRADVAAGAVTTANIAIKAMPAPPNQPTFVDFDELYPPSPARDLMVRSCFPCHGPKQRGGFHGRPWKTEAEWRRRVGYMFEPNRIVSLGRPVLTDALVSPAERESIVQYLTANFGPGSAARELKLDPLIRDEPTLSQALYVEYELPPNERANFSNGPAERGVHDVFPGRTPETRGVIWLAGMQSGSILRLDTKVLDFRARTKEYPIRHAGNVNVQPHAIIEDRGRVYFTQLSGAAVGEFTPDEGEVRSHATPTPNARPHTLRADSKGNLWYSNFDAGKIGRFDPVTKTMTEYEPITGKPWNGYGIIVDRHDRVWASGLTEPALAMFDPKTNAWRTFPLSAPTRRLTEDPKGRIWACHYFGNAISMVDPDTGRVTEFPLPLKNGDPYEVWADADGNLWIDNVVYNSIVKFDPNAKTFTYYPFPVLDGHAPKIEIDQDGTMWWANFASRPMPIVSFKPKGNAGAGLSGSR